MNPILNLSMLFVHWTIISSWLFLPLVVGGIVFFFCQTRIRKLKHSQAEIGSKNLELQALLHHSKENEKKMGEDLKLKDDDFRKIILQLNHEIRTPLNSITGMSSLLEGTTLNSEQQQYVQSIQNCSDKVADALGRVVNTYQSAKATVAETVAASVVEGIPSDDTAIAMNFSSAFAKQYPLKVLVAEDDAMNQQLALMLLSKLGYTPDFASDGKAVLEMVGDKDYDLILMDVQMPVMDGLQATRMIRLCLTSQPAIVAMTANSLDGDRDLCLEAGMNDYISKPVHRDLLMEKLGKWSLRLSK